MTAVIIMIVMGIIVGYVLAIPSMKNRQRVCIFVFLLIFCCPITANSSPEQIKNSIGRVTFHFDPPVKRIIYDAQKQRIDEEFVTEKFCNGFLVKKEDKIYLITVLHSSKIFDDGLHEITQNGVLQGYFEYPECRDFSNKISINIPNVLQANMIPVTRDNFFEGDTIQENGESVDIACIDVTPYVDKRTAADIISYEMLADVDKKAEIQDGRDTKLCGYSGRQLSNIEETNYQEMPVPDIKFPKNEFGEFLEFENGKRVRGFIYDLEAHVGDCGRLIITQLPSGYSIIGINRYAIEFREGIWLKKASVANDSTAIRQTINAFHHRSKETRQYPVVRAAS